MSIWLRAYGGTGNLISRAFITMMMVNPLQTTNESIEVFLMDYDDISAKDSQNQDPGNDKEEFVALCKIYKELHDMNLDCMGKIPIVHRNDAQLAEVRNRTFNCRNSENTYALNSIFGDDVKELMLSCFSMDQFMNSNAKGCYGDLARNAMVAYPMETGDGFTETHSDMKSATKVFYFGSTDGGTANTVMDRDINALWNRQPVRDKGRSYSLYSVRTLPYKTHKVNSDNPYEAADAERIKNDAVAQSKGVLTSVLGRNDYVKTGNLAEGVGYKLDGLFIAGYNVNDHGSFDDTNVYKTRSDEKAHTSNQHHSIHGTELAAAMMAIDCLNGGITAPSSNSKAVYGYNAVPPAERSMLTLEDFLSDNEIATGEEKNTVKLAKRVKACVHLYVIVSKYLQGDFQKAGEILGGGTAKLPSGRFSPTVITMFKKMYNVGPFKGGAYDAGEIKSIASNMETFINAGRQLVKMLYSVESKTQFGGKCGFCFFDKERRALKNLTEPDNGDYCYSFEKLYEYGRKDDNCYMAVIGEVVSTFKSDIENIKDGRDDKQITAKLIDLIYQALLLNTNF